MTYSVNCGELVLPWKFSGASSPTHIKLDVELSPKIIEQVPFGGEKNKWKKTYFSKPLFLYLKDEQVLV